MTASPEFLAGAIASEPSSLALVLPLTTKGDLVSWTTLPIRLPVGADTYVLTADSAEASGLKWVAPSGGASPLTTKGDIFGFTTADARLAVGADGFVLTADSGAATGLSWAAPGGVSDGDKGDISVTASGATWTIDAGVVTLAKMADMATASILGRNTGGAGAPEVLSAATAKSLLSLNNVENTALSTWAGTTAITTLGTIVTGTVPAANVSGLATVATSGSASDLGTGTLPVARIADTTLPLAKLLYSTAEATETAGTYNDYAIGTADALRMQGAGGNLILTGIAAGADGRVLSLHNFHSSNTITLKAEDAGSAAANRFGIAADVVLAGIESVVLQYEASAFTDRWRVIARNQASVVAAHSLSSHTVPAAAVDFDQQQATNFVIENRTSDPGSPVEGQIWLRTDL